MSWMRGGESHGLMDLMPRHATPCYAMLPHAPGCRGLAFLRHLKAERTEEYKAAEVDGSVLIKYLCLVSDFLLDETSAELRREVSGIQERHHGCCPSTPSTAAPSEAIGAWQGSPWSGAG